MSQQPPIKDNSDSILNNIGFNSGNEGSDDEKNTPISENVSDGTQNIDCKLHTDGKFGKSDFVSYRQTNPTTTKNSDLPIAILNWLVGDVGNMSTHFHVPYLPNLPYQPNRPNLPKSNNTTNDLHIAQEINAIKSDYNFDKKEMILLSIWLEPKTYNDIQKEFSMSRDSTILTFTRPSRNSGLLDMNLVRIKDWVSKSPLYEITQKGIDRILAIVEHKKQCDELINRELSPLSESNIPISEIIEMYRNYLFSQQKDDIHQVPKNNHITIDVNKLREFSPELSLDLELRPEEHIRMIRLALEHSTEQIDSKHIEIGFTKGLPLKIGHRRSEHINKLIEIEGQIVQASEIFASSLYIKFECPSCGNIIPITQKDINRVMLPSFCPKCKHKGRFSEIDKQLTDMQVMVLEERGQDIGAKTQASKINVMILGKHNTSESLDIIKNIGMDIKIVGILKEQPLEKNRSKTNKSITFIELLYIEGLSSIIDVKISDEEREKLYTIAHSPSHINFLTSSFAPQIALREKEKEAVLLSIVGSDTKQDEKRQVTHLLLVGDGGVSKSQLIKSANEIMPYSRMASGSGSSGVGLTASAVKDELTGQHMLRPGALPLSQNSTCFCDEFDKLEIEDMNALNTGLENGIIPVNKANINTVLRVSCNFIAAANPKLGRFDVNEGLLQQIKAPAPLLQRFDILLAIIDVREEKYDEAIGDRIIGLNVAETKMDKNLLARYIHLAHLIDPNWTMEAMIELKTWWKKIRGGSEHDNNARINARTLEAMRRIARNYAKLRFSEKIEVEDVHKAIEMQNYAMNSLGLISKDAASSLLMGISTSERSTIMRVRKVILSLELSAGKLIPSHLIFEHKDLSDLHSDKVTDSISKLEQSGDIFQPKRNFISVLK